MMLASRTTPVLSPARLGHIAGAVAAQPEAWGDVLLFEARRRGYRRLELADDHEVWLLTWLPGQSTGFHDHGDAAGAVAGARGGGGGGTGTPLPGPAEERGARGP